MSIRGGHRNVFFSIFALYLFCGPWCCGAFVIVDTSSPLEVSPVDDVVHHQYVPPELPSRIRSILYEDWAVLDEDAPRMIANLSSKPEVMEFPHARSTFRNHLIGTYSILLAWNQPRDICRPGLFHTSYSGDLFQFFIWNAADESERAELRSIVGGDSENIIYLFGTIFRGSLLGLSKRMDWADQRPMDTLNSSIVVFNRVVGEEIRIPPKEVAKVLLVTVADYLDQMVTVNGWRDHHQMDPPTSLFPGEDRPEIAFYWLSDVCRAIRDHLDVVPPCFDHCRLVISYEDEKAARDLYWQVMVDEQSLSVDEQKGLLLQAVRLNPFIAEPHALLAQLHFRVGEYEETRTQCEIALRKWYALASAWDKRRSFATWVHYTRLLHVRATRKRDGLHHLPAYQEEANTKEQEKYRTSMGLPLVSLKELVNAMP